MCYLDLYVPPGAIIMVSEDPKMSKPGTAGKRKHPTLALPQKYEIIKTTVLLWFHWLSMI
jgi:hypothetical protein